MKKEYIIWGIPNGESEEQILLSEFEGEKITDKDEAYNLAKLIIKKFNPEKIRVQEIDFEIDFTKAFKSAINI